MHNKALHPTLMGGPPLSLDLLPKMTFVQLGGKRDITGMAGTHRSVLESKQINGLPPREW